MVLKPSHNINNKPLHWSKSHAASSLSVSVSTPTSSFNECETQISGFPPIQIESSESSSESSESWPEYPTQPVSKDHSKLSFLDKYILNNKIIHYPNDNNNNQHNNIEVIKEPPLSSSSSSSVPSGGASIFKKMISRKTLIPKTKAFKRITADMQFEQCPLDEEIHHELLTTIAMREDDLILNYNPHNIHNTQNLNNIQHMQSIQNKHNFELIHKANESWNKNRRKSTNSINSQSTTNGLNDTIIFNKKPQLQSSKTKSSISIPSLNRKRKRLVDDLQTYNDNSNNNNINLTDQGSEHGSCVETDPETDTETSHLSWMISNKRRLVSASVTNSPKSPAMEPFPSRRNSVLFLSLQSASDELENMSLK